MKQPRVLLADGHKLLLKAFRELLKSDCKVVGSVTDGHVVSDFIKSGAWNVDDAQGPMIEEFKKKSGLK